MKLKICGITRKSDAEFCDSVGVDYLGFNFYKESKRYLNPETAKEIIASLKNAKAIGVFVEQNVRYISEITGFCKLSGIQIHGEESVDFCKVLKELFPQLIIIQAFRIKEKLPENLDQFNADFFLFDSFDPDSFGGTGKRFDWKILPLIRPVAYKSFIAGGINPENIDKLISSLVPFGIDVASGVEKSPGIKDFEKIRLIVEKVKGKSSEKDT